MKKIILLALVSVLLSGCDAKTEEIGQKYTLPDGLKDCQIYRLDPSRGKILYVVRCSKSQTTTSYMSNKTNTSTTLLED